MLQVQVVAASRDMSSPMHRSSSRTNVDDVNENEDEQPLLIAADNEDDQASIIIKFIFLKAYLKTNNFSIEACIAFKT